MKQQEVHEHTDNYVCVMTGLVAVLYPGSTYDDTDAVRIHSMLNEVEIFGAGNQCTPLAVFL